MKKIGYLLYALLILAVIGLLVYDYLPDRVLEKNALSRAGILLISLVLGILKVNKPRRRKVSNTKALYTKAYPQYIQNVFPDDKKSEKLFFAAVEDYNLDHPAAAVEKLTKLRGECINNADRYAVTVFTALCLDDMRLDQKAAEQYRAALQIKPESALASNLGLVLERLGNVTEAEAAYSHSIRLNPSNPIPLNNLAQSCIRAGNYQQGREYALKAIAINPKMRQALSAMAICSYMLGDQESYTKYYHQAVANGYDGEKLKNFLRAMNPEL